MKTNLRLLLASLALVALAAAAETTPPPAAPTAPTEVAPAQNKNAPPAVATPAPAPADLAGLKFVPIADAIKAAVATSPGKVTKVTLEAKDGTAVYAVEIPGADNSITSVIVDATSGKVTGSSVEFGAKQSSAPMPNGTMKSKSPSKEDDDD